MKTLVWGKWVGKSSRLLSVPGRLRKVMNFPQFLVGMTTVSSVVALSTFLATGSIWKALAWTILALIVLQAGYFVLVVRLIYGDGAEDAEANPWPVGAGRPEHRGGVRPGP